MGGPEPAQDVRKTVTILFADIVNSSRLSLTLDPEALRNLLARYFDEMNSIIQRHGGTVEGSAGDDIMAVCGVPTLHEDDALRAVSAAVEMRDTLATLNRSLRRFGACNWLIGLASTLGRSLPASTDRDINSSLARLCVSPSVSRRRRLPTKS